VATITTMIQRGVSETFVSTATSEMSGLVRGLQSFAKFLGEVPEEHRIISIGALRKAGLNQLAALEAMIDGIGEAPDDLTPSERAEVTEMQNELKLHLIGVRETFEGLGQ